MGLGEARVQGFEGGVEFLQGALLSQGLEEEGLKKNNKKKEKQMIKKIKKLIN